MQISGKIDAEANPPAAAANAPDEAATTPAAAVNTPTAYWGYVSSLVMI